MAARKSISGFFTSSFAYSFVVFFISSQPSVMLIRSFLSLTILLAVQRIMGGKKSLNGFFISWFLYSSSQPSVMQVRSFLYLAALLAVQSVLGGGRKEKSEEAPTSSLFQENITRGGTNDTHLAEEQGLCMEGLAPHHCSYRDFGVGERDIMDKEMVDLMLSGEWVEVEKTCTAVEVLHVCCHGKTFIITLGKKRNNVEYGGKVYELREREKKSGQRHSRGM